MIDHTIQKNKSFISTIFKIFSILLFIYSCAFSQIKMDSTAFKSPILFGKLGGTLFFRDFRPDRYARFFHCYDKNAFIESNLLKNSRGEYKKSGWMYYKFQKHCITNNIYYNPKELKHYRKMAIISAIVYGLAVGQPIVIAIDAWNYAAITGYYKQPQVYFKSKAAPYLWSIYVIEWGTSLTIKTRAEKRLQKKIFIKETCE